MYYKPKSAGCSGVFTSKLTSCSEIDLTFPVLAIPSRKTDSAFQYDVFPKCRGASKAPAWKSGSTLESALPMAYVETALA
jgi:hypothetical protein